MNEKVKTQVIVNYTNYNPNETIINISHKNTDTKLLCIKSESKDKTQYDIYTLDKNENLINIEISEIINNICGITLKTKYNRNYYKSETKAIPIVKINQEGIKSLIYDIVKFINPKITNTAILYDTLNEIGNDIKNEVKFKTLKQKLNNNIDEYIKSISDFKDFDDDLTNLRKLHKELHENKTLTHEV